MTKLWKCAGDGDRKKKEVSQWSNAGQEGSVDDYFVLAKYLGFAVALKQTLVQSCVCVCVCVCVFKIPN